jgi:hypothetical protein
MPCSLSFSKLGRDVNHWLIFFFAAFLRVASGSSSLMATVGPVSVTDPFFASWGFLPLCINGEADQSPKLKKKKNVI